MTLKYFCVEDDQEDKVPDHVSGFQVKKTEVIGVTMKLIPKWLI